MHCFKCCYGVNCSNSGERGSEKRIGVLDGLMSVQLDRLRRILMKNSCDLRSVCSVSVFGVSGRFRVSRNGNGGIESYIGLLAISFCPAFLRIGSSAVG